MSTTLQGKKLGILVSTDPKEPGFLHAMALAETALNRGVDVYFYCIDNAVLAHENTALQALRLRGLRLFLCAYAARSRNIPISEAGTFCGLTIVSDLITGTDRFVSFN